MWCLCSQTVLFQCCFPGLAILKISDLTDMILSQEYKEALEQSEASGSYGLLWISLVCADSTATLNTAAKIKGTRQILMGGGNKSC